MNVKSVRAEFSLLKKVGDLTLQPQPRQDAFFSGQGRRERGRYSVRVGT